MSTRSRSKKHGRKRQKAAADAEERATSQTPTPPAADRTRSHIPPIEAAAVDEILEVVSGPSHAGHASETLPSIDKVKGRGKKSNEKAADHQLELKPMKNFTLSPEQEDAVSEWLEENELLWRRGHRLLNDSNRKMALWEEKGRELDVSSEHLQGWWRGVHTWYVKLHKVKSGQAAKKLTDIEKYVLQKCSFYEGELRHRSSAPIKAPPREVVPDAAEAAFDAGSELESVFPVEADRDEEVQTEWLLSNIEKTAAKASKGPVYNREGTSRSKKRKRQDAEEEECLREIRDSMKANTQLLSQLVGEKSPSSRELFITYVSDTLKRPPGHQYDAMKRKITSLLQILNATDFSSADDLPSIQPTTPRLRQSLSAPPQDLNQPYPEHQQPQRPAYPLYQSYPELQQPHRPAYPEYQLYPQYQQPQRPAYPQYQPTQQLQQPSSSGATDQPSPPEDTFSQVLELTHDVLGGCLNLLNGSNYHTSSLRIHNYMYICTSPQMH